MLYATMYFCVFSFHSSFLLESSKGFITAKHLFPADLTVKESNIENLFIQKSLKPLWNFYEGYILKYNEDRQSQATAKEKNPDTNQKHNRQQSFFLLRAVQKICVHVSYYLFKYWSGTISG